MRLSAFPPDTVVIHGDARGADRLADHAARGLGLKVEPYPADWSRYGKRAGILRNLEMLDSNPTTVIAFWDGESRGTQHTIDEARKRGIRLWIVKADDDRFLPTGPPSEEDAERAIQVAREKGWLTDDGWVWEESA